MRCEWRVDVHMESERAVSLGDTTLSNFSKTMFVALGLVLRGVGPLWNHNDIKILLNVFLFDFNMYC